MSIFRKSRRNLFVADHAHKIRTHCACAASVGVQKPPPSLERSVAPQTHKRTHHFAAAGYFEFREQQTPGTTKFGNSEFREKRGTPKNGPSPKTATKNSPIPRHFFPYQKLSEENKNIRESTTIAVQHPPIEE